MIVIQRIVLMLYHGETFATSMFHVLSFFGLLFLASLLVGPEVFLTQLPPRQQIWVLRRWTARVSKSLTTVLAAVFMALLGWVIYSGPQNAHAGGQKQLPKNPPERSLVVIPRLRHP